MSFLSDFARGFLAKMVIILILNTIAVGMWGYVEVAILFLLILPIPLSIIAKEFSEYWKNRKEINWTDKLRRTSTFLYGFSFACWFFDVITTYYAVNVLGVAAEQNPLGWPLGAFGPLTFYVPAFACTYLLIFKVRQGYSLVAGMLISVLASWFGFMNFIAGSQNFGFFTTYFKSPSIEVYIFLFCLLTLTDSTYAVIFYKIRKTKQLKANIP
jgi:hypothetical protein